MAGEQLIVEHPEAVTQRFELAWDTPDRVGTPVPRVQIDGAQFVPR